MRTLFCLVFLVACGTDPAIETVAHGPATTIAVDQTSYAPGQTITATWAGMPGGAMDWVGIAPAGSPATTVIAWSYSPTASGMHGFVAPSTPGSYVARAFIDDGYVQVAESAAFTIASSGVTTDHASYIVSDPVVASWTGLPGNQHDWIAVAPAGSSVQTVFKWDYTYGATSGMKTFVGIPVGSWVARTFLDDGYTLLGETSFTVGPPTVPMVTVTTNSSTYTFDDAITVSWSGFTPTPKDWIAIAPQGSPLTQITYWVYTAGTASGSRVIGPPNVVPPAHFVARAFVNDSYVLAGESAPFDVIVSLTTNATSYVSGQAITTSWSRIPTAVGPLHLRFVPTTGQPIDGSGTLFDPGSFTLPFGLPAGTYVAQLTSSSSAVVAESASFVVSPGQPSITTNGTSFFVGWYIGGTYLNFPGPQNKVWIAVAPAGSPITATLDWAYTTATSGPYSLRSPNTPGTYVVRAFTNDAYVQIAETAPFTVTN